MDILLLRLDAPLMSFGAVMVDQHGPTWRFPATSMLTGLLGNALGYTHADAGKLDALQARITFAARWDVPPQPLVDYHTVDLRQEKMRHPGWTTRGKPEHRDGGDAAKYGTHIRYRHYLANGVMTVALTLEGEGPPTVANLAAALAHPARPLYIGRKSCLPSAPLLLGQTDAQDVRSALATAARHSDPSGRAPDGPLEACWPLGPGASAGGNEVAVYDRRDWANQVHAGRHLRVEGLLREENP